MDIHAPLCDDIAAMARKRRIELRNQQRVHDVASDSGACDSQSVVSVTSESSDPESFDDTASLSPRKRARKGDRCDSPSDSKPSLTGVKKNSRYDPGVPMTREELTAWRKEARRVRNRESAAASRRRNRERITELETEVEAIKSKYAQALQRIVELEAKALHQDSFTPTTLRQTSCSPVTSAPSSPFSPAQRTSSKTVSPPMSPRISARDAMHHEEVVSQKYQHIMEMISRPIAYVS